MQEQAEKVGKFDQKEEPPDNEGKGWQIRGYFNKEILRHEESKNSAEEGSSRRLFNFAVPSSMYYLVCKVVKRCSKNKSNFGSWARIAIEKSLEYSEKFNTQVGGLYEDPKVYSIDQNIRKGLVQNLKRLGNGGGDGYFDECGIYCDINKHYSLQIQCLVAMEKHVSLRPEHMWNKKVKVLQPIFLANDVEVVLGQYQGYMNDLTRKAEMNIQFKDVPGDIFKCQNQGRNELVICLQSSKEFLHIHHFPKNSKRDVIDRVSTEREEWKRLLKHNLNVAKQGMMVQVDENKQESQIGMRDRILLKPQHYKQLAMHSRAPRFQPHGLERFVITNLRWKIGTFLVIANGIGYLHRNAGICCQSWRLAALVSDKALLDTIQKQHGSSCKFKHWQQGSQELCCMCWREWEGLSRQFQPSSLRTRKLFRGRH